MMKCLACGTDLPILPEYRTTEAGSLRVTRHYKCVICGLYTHVPALTPLQPVSLAPMMRRRSRDERPEEAGYRRGYRDCLGEVLCALEEMVDEGKITFGEAFKLLYHHYSHELADWQHARPGETIPPPAIPVPVSRARSR